MGTYRFTLEADPKPEELQLLSHGLTDHALPFTTVPGFKTLAVFMRDERGQVVGGAWGQVNWNWISVSVLWLSDDLRGYGYGRRLMVELEQAAKAQGCEQAHIETFSFQARPFYEALGYEVFAALEEYPKGYKKYFMKKRL
jgi:GNAT superfamily N-acetyltransferase